MTARKDATAREPLHLRGGGSVALTTATPAQPLVPGRSLNLDPHIPRTGNALTSRTLLARGQSSPGRDVSVGSAASKCGQPGNLASRMEEVKQEDRREALQRYLESKRQGTAATPSAPPPRVPALNMAALQSGAGAGAPGIGSSTARVSGAGAAPATGAAPPMSARGNYAGTQQQQQARGMAAPAPVSARGTSAAAAAAARGRAGSGAGVITAMAPPPPRGPAAAAAAADSQVLQRALRKQLPAFDVEEALRVPLPDGNEDAFLRTPVSLPSSRIAKSPLRGAVAGGGMAPVPFSLIAGSGHMAQALAGTAAAGFAASQPARSPPPLSARGAAPAGPAADMAGSRLGSNAEASTSDIAGRSMRDQLKAVRLLELQYRVLTVKAEAAARARFEKGARQLHSMAVLLAQMMKRSVEVQRELAAARTAARTQHVLDTQLPLLERWAAVQDVHAHATREVLTALQNAMTSLPLVNGAGLGGSSGLSMGGMGLSMAMGGGANAAALQQLRSALAKGLGSLQSCEAALRLLLQGSRHGGAGQAAVGGGGDVSIAVAGSEVQPPQGGVPAMADLLPRLHETLVGEVCALRSLLEDLNGLAAKMDEGACLRARMSDAGGADTTPYDGGLGFGLDQGAQPPHQPGCGMEALDRTMDQALQMLDLDLP
ncbi:hypothetical protein HYH02_000488 [Chlamydomonas schloesseri]|uniref:Uncharacterized protein n=1 Tax=Chlamydomonas schloesseri TaxID=2026947 RepID=A0A835WUQ7_9CHLO|nr:hypothetical protein HYH02_000488 [Chlamydomonas schloesseri]|eukprot:KAG2454648.1 hypothetical protein HYH02_000488 [Chlamydomonas schloesseri]